MITRWLLAIVVCAGLAGWLGYQKGHESGTLEVRAEVDSQAVEDLNTIIQSHKDLVEEANQASLDLQAASARRARYDDNTTEELRNVLAETAGLRADVRFAAGVMRQLEAARDRAAAAAAGGLDEPVSGAAAGARE
ncbi:MAG: hypothetical protein CL543_09095 [Alcanivorax sp.]|nr:hypothetical protein [Alcanivorax sp.]MAY12006.1 hypothetical protein [Alcanivorax sp.]MBI55608.1 hypothetical protein [Alcanivorax sp.]MBU59023.1 hypothetical protein [Alcanivorax sp.]|tara:strand:+ start:85603 stop:86010 length:408 start_codon:yes stop_codon:yes gene_type:complete